MKKRRSPPVLHIAVFALIAVLAVLVVMLTSNQSAAQSRLAAKQIRARIPDVALSVDTGLFTPASIRVMAPDLGAPGGMRSLAVVRPVGSGRFNVALFNSGNGEYSASEGMNLEQMVTGIRNRMPVAMASYD